MAKPKGPLLSLGARGTIGDALTFQKRDQGTIVREKPIPRDPYSLNQAYQRWDYRDYAYLWTLLSNSEKQVYRTKASRYHITGFSQWMRENLKDLPSLMGRWHLDEKSGAVAFDTSRNDNNGVIYGASPATGVIDGAFSFDGLNDYIDLGNPPSLINMTEKSLFCFFKAGPFTGTRRSLYYSSYWTAPYGGIIFLTTNANTVQIFLRNTVLGLAFRIIPFVPDAWHSLAYSWDGSAVQFYFDGEPWLAPVAFTGILACTAKPIHLGNEVAAQWYNGLLDHFIIWNRPLDSTEIQQRSERRYPT